MELIQIFILLLLAAFFNGVETGLISINRIKLHARLDDGRKSAKALERLLKNSENAVGTFLIGTSACEVAAIILLTDYLTLQIGDVPLIPLYTTLIMTPVMVFFATLLPKVMFREYADEWMYGLSYPLTGIYYLLYPVQFLFSKIIRFVLGIFGIRKKKSMFSKDEFNILLDITADKGMLKQSERDFIESIMNFKNVKAKEIMLPLIRMTCVEKNDTVEVASALMLTTRHSRIPVFDMRVDNMIGYVENKDLLDAGRSDKVGKYVRESIFVPDLTPTNQVLLRMQTKKAPLAFVVDEYGGVAGVITNQNIIAEIIGEFVEVRDEFIQKDGKAWIVNGMLAIDDLNERLNLRIEKSDFETAAGFVLYKLGRIPETGDRFDEGRFTFEVISASNVRVKKIRIYPRRLKEKKQEKPKPNADRRNKPKKD